ncbi:hypothetical protein ACRAWD_00055 [Caulobacter segnis]
MRFEVPVGQPIRYKTLINCTVRACGAAAADEIAPETAAYVIASTPSSPGPGRRALLRRPGARSTRVGCTPVRSRPEPAAAPGLCTPG